MFGALKGGRFRSLASLILVVNVVGELQQKRTHCGIARFPCGSTAFLYALQFGLPFSGCALSVAPIPYPLQSSWIHLTATGRRQMITKA